MTSRQQGPTQKIFWGGSYEPPSPPASLHSSGVGRKKSGGYRRFIGAALTANVLKIADMAYYRQAGRQEEKMRSAPTKSVLVKRV